MKLYIGASATAKFNPLISTNRFSLFIIIFGRNLYQIHQFLIPFYPLRYILQILTKVEFPKYSPPSMAAKISTIFNSPFGDDLGDALDLNFCLALTAQFS